MGVVVLVAGCEDGGTEHGFDAQAGGGFVGFDVPG